MKIYEDGAVIAETVEDGAAVGHVKVTSQKDVQFLYDLTEEEAVQMFYAASFAATGVFEGLGAQGTNIIINEGDGPLAAHVLPRNPEDGMDFFWEPKRAEQAELDATAAKIKDALFYVGKDEAPTTKQVTENAPKKEESSVPPEENYKLQHLNRRM